MNINAFVAGAVAGLLLVKANEGFAEPVLAGLSIGSQNPVSVQAGETAVYDLMVYKTGIGSLNRYLSISPLPAGVTASFTPAALHFAPNQRPSLPATLKLFTTSQTPAGVYPFTVTARHGSSRKVHTAEGTLVVANNSRLLAPAVLWIERLTATGVKIVCHGSANQAYRIEVSAAISGQPWSVLSTNMTDATGTFALEDISNAQTRFYRAVVHN